MFGSYGGYGGSCGTDALVDVCGVNLAKAFDDCMNLVKACSPDLMLRIAKVMML